MASWKMVAMLYLIITKLDWNGCTVSDVRYAHRPAWKDKVCQTDYRLFSVTTRTAVECLVRCTEHRPTDCLSIFYNKVTLACDGCWVFVDNINLLIDKTGTISYTKLLSCGPLPATPRVIYGEYVVTALIGYKVTYTCSPCTYFPPPGEAGVVTCQANGTWTTPICVNAAATGFLQNGNPVPAGATGCATTFYGNTCPHDGYEIIGFHYMASSTSMSGCFCDGVCCGKSDCCYDFGC